jgi:arylsulfatase A
MLDYRSSRFLAPSVAAGVLLALGLFAEASAADAAKARPNIIFILADDYGITGAGCYGGRYKTPNLDALAQGGTRFEYCFSAPLCAPSRALAMTGRYAFRTGVLNNGSGGRATPQREVCIAKLMKQAGYATAVAGKWRQLTYFTTKQDGLAWGFDEFLIWGVDSKGERYWNPAYNKNGQWLTDTEGKYGPDLLHQFVVDFIRRNQDRPFFVYYPMVLVHGPILRTPDSPAGSRDLLADNIAYMDKLLGKLVEELDRLKLREKTLIVFTGDNGCVRGGTLNGRAIDGAKGSMKEGGSRVPLVVNWKGTTPAGRVFTDLVDFSDFFPTFAELGGAKLPEGVTIDGRSFAPQLLGQPGNPRQWVYVQLGAERYVRDARWKLTGDGALSDMTDAPFREIPVPTGSDDAQARAARKKLQGVLDELKSQDKTDWGAVAKAKKKAAKKAAGKAGKDSGSGAKRRGKKQRAAGATTEK